MNSTLLSFRPSICRARSRSRLRLVLFALFGTPQVFWEKRQSSKLQTTQQSSNIYKWRYCCETECDYAHPLRFFEVIELVLGWFVQDSTRMSPDDHHGNDGSKERIFNQKKIGWSTLWISRGLWIHFESDWTRFVLEYRTIVVNYPPLKEEDSAIFPLFNFWEELFSPKSLFSPTLFRKKLFSPRVKKMCIICTIC